MLLLTSFRSTSLVQRAHWKEHRRDCGLQASHAELASGA